MKQQHVDYQVLLYPKLRRIIAVMLRSFQRMPMIHGLLEVDVTKARSPEEAQSKNWGVLVVHGIPHCLPGKSRR